MALMNLKGLMKQKTMGAMPTMPGAGAPPPFAPTGTAAPKGLLKKPWTKPSQSTEVSKMPSLMKRLTGK